MTDQPFPEIDGGTPPHAIEDAPAPPSLFHAGASVLREAAQFLSDRLDDLEWMDGELESTCRDYMGHVDPAHDRLKSALATHSPAPMAGEPTDAQLKDAVSELLSHRGERPERVLRGGHVLWETWLPAFRAALRYLPAAAHPSTQEGGK